MGQLFFKDFFDISVEMCEKSKIHYKIIIGNLTVIDTFYC